jgi:hypothetical protein
VYVVQHHRPAVVYLQLSHSQVIICVHICITCGDATSVEVGVACKGDMASCQACEPRTTGAPRAASASPTASERRKAASPEALHGCGPDCAS